MRPILLAIVNGNRAIISEIDCSRMIEESKCSDPEPCNVYSGGQLCEAGLVVYGAGANTRMVDCKALGFSGCVSVPNGGPYLAQVHCVP